MARKSRSGKSGHRKTTKHFSGHGSVHYKVLGKRQLKNLKTKGHTHVSVNGVKKKVTRGNLTRHNNKVAVGWYTRSDTKKPALRQYARDRSIAAGHKKGWSSKRGMETDRRNGGGV